MTRIAIPSRPVPRHMPGADTYQPQSTWQNRSTARLNTLAQCIEAALTQTAVIIPVRDPQDSLSLVLADLPDVGLRIVVTHDPDNAAMYADDCELVNEPRRGYGHACRAGLSRLDQICRDRGIDIQYVAFLDADYHDHPEELYRLLLPFLNDEADMVMGSRLMGRLNSDVMPISTIWGNRLACWAMSLISKTEHTDLGHFRVIRRETLRTMKMRGDQEGWAVEMLIHAAQLGIRSVEVPVAYRRRISARRPGSSMVRRFQVFRETWVAIARSALARPQASKS